MGGGPRSSHLIQVPEQQPRNFSKDENIHTRRTQDEVAGAAGFFEDRTSRLQEVRFTV